MTNSCNRCGREIKQPDWEFVADRLSGLDKDFGDRAAELQRVLTEVHNAAWEGRCWDRCTTTGRVYATRIDAKPRTFFGASLMNPKDYGQKLYPRP